MRTDIIYIALITSLFVCCKSNISKQNDEIFVPQLRTNILNFLEYSDSVYKNAPPKDMLYAVAVTGRKEPLLYLYTDFFYNKNMLGYTYINNKLVVCYNFREDDYKQYLIDTTKLIRFKDSIPGYRSNECIDMSYEILKYIYSIDSTNNLSLIFVGF